MFCQPDSNEIFNNLLEQRNCNYEPINGKDYVSGRVKKTFRKE